MAASQAGLCRRIVVPAEGELRCVRAEYLAPGTYERRADSDLRAIQEIPTSNLLFHIVPNTLLRLPRVAGLLSHTILTRCRIRITMGAWQFATGGSYQVKLALPNSQRFKREYCHESK